MTFSKKTAIFFIGLVSNFFRLFGGRACRFYPSCSEYARQAMQSENILKASLMALKRVLRCHPFSAGGYDPVIVSSKKES